MPAAPWYVSADEVDITPDDLQVSKTQYDRVWGYIDAGKQEGAKVVLGGTKRKCPGNIAVPERAKISIRSWQRFFRGPYK